MRRKGFDLLISYAHPDHGHHGGVYQAASWRFAAKRPPCNLGVRVNGKDVHSRTANGIWGTNSPAKIRDLVPGVKVERIRDSGKYLYWRALNRRGKAKAKRLGLKSLPYPKPGVIRSSA